MAPPDTIWHNESLKLKEIFGTREGFKICPYQLLPAPIKAPSGTAVVGIHAVEKEGETIAPYHRGRAQRRTTCDWGKRALLNDGPPKLKNRCPPFQEALAHEGTIPNCAAIQRKNCPGLHPVLVLN